MQTLLGKQQRAGSYSHSSILHQEHELARILYSPPQFPFKLIDIHFHLWKFGTALLIYAFSNVKICSLVLEISSFAVSNRKLISSNCSFPIAQNQLFMNTIRCFFASYDSQKLLEVKQKHEKVQVKK